MTTESFAIAPDATEFAPYYGKYTSRVKTENIIATLESQAVQTKALFGAVSEADAGFRYAPEKWSIRQMLGHVTDSERIFSYRALRIARGDKTPIEGFEQDDYVRNAPFERCTLNELLNEFAAVRDATVRLFRSFDQGAWTRRGVASSNEVSVRALAYIIAGHELHHIEVLRERYLPALKGAR
jgi:uncharacterized damage-inducible protein DinB